MITFLQALFTAFMYRVKGGGFIKLTDTIVRIAFASTVAGLFYLHNSSTPNALWAASLMIPFGWLAQCIGHGAYQAMGHYPAPQWTYVAFWLPRYVQLQWSTMSQVKRTINDMLGMMMVGVWRGILTFIPPFLLLNWGSVTVYWFCLSLLPALLLAIWYPIAYLVGYYVPFTICDSLKQQKNWQGTEWSEFLVGFGWYFAERVFVI